MKISDLGEFAFIDRVSKGSLHRKDGVIAGIGDDCAVFRVSDHLAILLTADMLIEDVHFRRGEIPAELLGRKSLAASISDIAAMGGTPREAFVSIGIPENFETEYLDKIYGGLNSIAAEFEINVLGGDTVLSPDRLVMNVALTGEARETEILYRKGAMVGDIVFITGEPGLSSAGLDLLRNNRDFANKELFLAAHFDPVPQTKAGRILASTGKAHSLIDISDGLAADLGHICGQSGVGAIVEINKIPLAAELREYCRQFRLDIENFVLHGGEDYILLGTAPEKHSPDIESSLKSGGCRYFPIGRITDGASLTLIAGDGGRQELKLRGYDHFRK